MDIATADATIQSTLDAATSAAKTLEEKAMSYCKDATTLALGWVDPNPGKDIEKPNISIPKYLPADVDFKNLFDTDYANILGDLQGKFQPMLDILMDKMFPKMRAGLADDCDKWLDDTINNGGIGLPADVENAIFQAARDREIESSLIIKDLAFNEFAARGWELPTGALASRLQAADLEASKKISEANRVQMIETYKIRIETVKFAIGQTVELRKHATTLIMGMLMDYLKLPIVAGEIAIAKVNGYKALWDATAEYYRAVVTIEGFKLDVDKFNKEMSYKFQALFVDGWKVSHTTSVNASVSVADLFARVASAHLGAQNTMVQLSANTSYAAA